MSTLARRLRSARHSLFSPWDIPLSVRALWLSAADHVSTVLMTDDAGSGLISSWTGRGNLGQTFTAATTARPTYDPIGLGGVYPALVADGVANTMTMASVLGLPVGSADSVAIALASGTATARHLFSYGGTAGGTLRRLAGSSGNDVAVSNGTTSLNSVSRTWATPVIAVGSWASDLTINNRSDGGADTKAATMASNNTGTTRSRLFASTATSPSAFWAGPLAELVVLSGSLATLLPTIQKIEGYWAWQYPMLNLAAQFPADHPYKSGAP